MKLIFCLLITVVGFFKVILLFQVFVTRHAQITQETSLICLQHVKEEVSNASDFLHAGKH